MFPVDRQDELGAFNENFKPRKGLFYVPCFDNLEFSGEYFLIN